MAKKKQAKVQEIKEQKSKKVDAVRMIPPINVQIQVDMFLHAKEALEIQKKALESAAEQIRNHALDVAVHSRNMDAIQLQGTSPRNAVTVVHKDSYSCHDANQLKALLKAHEVNPSQFVQVVETVDVNISEMTKDEKEKLLVVLQKILDPARFLKLVEKKVDVQISGLKDQLAQIADDREDLDNLRKASGHWDAALYNK